MRGETPTELADSASSFVVTGCYDHHLRLWNVSADAVGESGAAQIVKVISGHKSHINSIVVNPTAGKAFSADGIGVIRVWSITKHAFDSVKEVNEPEVKGDALNCLVLDKTGKRLFVLARDNCIRMLDTDSWKVTQRFSGLRCMNHQIRCDVSPDGKFLASGSEDGQIFMWNVETGEQDTSVSRDRLPHFGSMCSDVAWNPAERIVACCSFSRKQPVLVYKHERDVDNLANDEITEEEAREVLQGKFSELAEAFRRLDKNGDGKLQLDEFRSGMISLEMDMSDVQILRMFKAAAGPNDEIDRDEFIKRFAPTGTFQKIKTSENIERARQARMDQPKQRRSAVMGLLDELDGGKKKDANTPKKDQGKGEEESPKKKTLARKNR
uniref:EF-hand domain-containing protein n=1 Tax=Hemiselmis tepida TaxID=464990 RepID=A0A7S0W345_9CRYP